MSQSSIADSVLFNIFFNPEKFQANLLDKINLYLNQYENITMSKKNTIKVNMLFVHIDSKLNFNSHIDIICKFASNQLNAFAQLKRCLDPDKRFVLVNTDMDIFN